MERNDLDFVAAGEPPILEYRRIGRLLRVAAIDPDTGTEVVIQGRASGDHAALERLALRKLAWALDRAAGRRRPGQH
ncbi:MAG TPA: hypothetical protein VNS22_24935 [Geminicoccus sp.]|uniref:DUF6898 family protein n=1 Tax=Geminicoccus sp. TaxID=2024832 RepID=UPI002B5392C0|nr:hypothetical protein [Geminicoccus sp.]HWL71603.1 hypothetical protein [Geminicoccus sp.]